MVVAPPVVRSRTVTSAAMAVEEWRLGATAVMVVEVQLVTVAGRLLMVTVFPGGSAMARRSCCGWVDCAVRVVMPLTALLKAAGAEAMVGRELVGSEVFH